MERTKNFVAFDLGASNGRALTGAFDGRRLLCEELHQFPNEPVRLHDGFYWDILRLFAGMRDALALYAKEHGADLAGVGVDSWGVDFGLLDRRGALIGNPHHYRDRRTDGMVERITGLVDGYEIYRTTGGRLTPISTLCQLHSLVRDESPQLAAADAFLMIPALLSYFLCGERFHDRSIVTPSGLYDIRRGAPAEELLRTLGIPAGIIGRIGEAGTLLGTLRGPAADETGAGPVPVIAPAMHDTASAVLSVPADAGKNWAFISSGTWSVLGFETGRPSTARENYESSITHAATAEDRFMTVSNMTGLWILQECRRAWEKGGERLSWPQLAATAGKAEAFRAFIDVDDARFVGPADMPEAVASYCRDTGQRPPEDRGATVRLVLESMALKYKAVLGNLASAAGTPFDVVHLVGGGSRNDLLCRFTASALGLPVLAGPFEATALGNLLMQMKAVGEIASVAEGRALLRDSVAARAYEPENPAAWDEAYAGYRRITGGQPC